MTENKMQNWRAVGITKDNTQHLLFVAPSYELIKKQYETAFYEILTDDEQIAIKDIQLERWQGLADKGKWMKQGSLHLPELIQK